jgi:transcriptional regulator with XRE-family HTH domain
MQGRKIVGWNVRKLRAAKGLTLEELAGRADTAATYLASLERGEVNAGVDLLDRLAQCLGVRLQHLTVEPDPGEKPPTPLKAGRRPRRSP